MNRFYDVVLDCLGVLRFLGTAVSNFEGLLVWCKSIQAWVPRADFSEWWLNSRSIQIDEGVSTNWRNPILPLEETLELFGTCAFYSSHQLTLSPAPRFREELESAIGVAAKAHGLPMVCPWFHAEDLLACETSWQKQKVGQLTLKFSYVTCHLCQSHKTAEKCMRLTGP